MSERTRTPKSARSGSRAEHPAPRTRSTAAARRKVLVEVAVRHFAERGYYGTPTLAIADEAGISQAYLFRLFPTKQDLFAACVDDCIERTITAFERGAASCAPGEPALAGIGRGYKQLLAEEPEVLLGQLHANAAAPKEPVVRGAIRRGWARLYERVAELSGAPLEEIRALFATGMLINVAAAARFDEVDEPWANVLGMNMEDQ